MKVNKVPSHQGNYIDEFGLFPMFPHLYLCGDQLLCMVETSDLPYFLLYAFM